MADTRNRAASRLERIVHGGDDDANRTQVGHFLNRGFERVGRMDHRRRADTGAGENHPAHLVADIVLCCISNQM